MLTDVSVGDASMVCKRLATTIAVQVLLVICILIQRYLFLKRNANFGCIKF